MKPVVFLSLLCMLTVGGAHAQSPQPVQIPPPARPHSTALLDCQKELALSPDQVTKIKKEIDTLKAATMSGRAKDAALKQQLNQMVKSDAALPAIKAKLTEEAMLSVDFQMVNFTANRNIKKILTPDQMKKYMAIRAAAQPTTRMPGMPPGH